MYCTLRYGRPVCGSRLGLKLGGDSGRTAFLNPIEGIKLRSDYIQNHLSNFLHPNLSNPQKSDQVKPWHWFLSREPQLNLFVATTVRSSFLFDLWEISRTWETEAKTFSRNQMRTKWWKQPRKRKTVVAFWGTSRGLSGRRNMWF